MLQPLNGIIVAAAQKEKHTEYGNAAGKVIGIKLSRQCHIPGRKDQRENKILIPSGLMFWEKQTFL